MLLITSVAFSQSQFRLNEMEYFATSVVIDPGASIKENGLNIGAEIEYNGAVYVRASVTTFAALKDRYTDTTGAFGVNFTSGYFEKIRYYTGIRGGFIHRAATHPTAGFEAGIDVMISDSVFIGIRSTYDRRGDADFYDGDQWRYSGFVKLGVKF